MNSVIIIHATLHGCKPGLTKHIDTNYISISSAN